MNPSPEASHRLSRLVRLIVPSVLVLAAIAYGNTELLLITAGVAGMSWFASSVLRPKTRDRPMSLNALEWIWILILVGLMLLGLLYR